MTIAKVDATAESKGIGQPNPNSNAQDQSGLRKELGVTSSTSRLVLQSSGNHMVSSTDLHHMTGCLESKPCMCQEYQQALDHSNSVSETSMG